MEQHFTLSYRRLRTLSIDQGIFQVLVSGDAKYFKLLEFLGQGDNVKVKKPDITIVPKLAWITLRAPFLVRLLV